MIRSHGFSALHGGRVAGENLGAATDQDSRLGGAKPGAAGGGLDCPGLDRQGGSSDKGHDNLHRRSPQIRDKSARPPA